MKYTIPYAKEVDLDIEFPAYYRGEHTWMYMMLKNERQMLTISLCPEMTSIDETWLTETTYETFIANGTQITPEKFANAFLKASAILTSYLPVPATTYEEQLTEALYDFQER